ncbi:hypothetical protein [Methylobacterium sp. E-005]|nr:hypothetical protein [Methylobacterium sp. E-005]
MRGRGNDGSGGPLPLAMTDAPNAETAPVVEDGMLVRMDARHVL